MFKPQSSMVLLPTSVDSDAHLSPAAEENDVHRVSFSFDSSNGNYYDAKNDFHRSLSTSSAESGGLRAVDMPDEDILHMYLNCKCSK